MGNTFISKMERPFGRRHGSLLKQNLIVISVVMDWGIVASFHQKTIFKPLSSSSFQMVIMLKYRC